MIELGRVDFRALGTGATVLTCDPAATAGAHTIALHEIDAIDRACSRFRDDSELSGLNRNSGSSFPASPVLIGALDVALRAAAITEGDLDPLIGGALILLGYDRTFEQVEGVGADPGVATLRRSYDWRDIEVDAFEGTVTIPRGSTLDLGATAKAWAVDRVARRIAAVMGSGTLVSIGGDIATAGPAPTGGWIVRIADRHDADPFGPGPCVAIHDGGLATSSTTARRWTRGQRTLHHILDPRTLQPADDYWRTVSATAATCVDANIATTTAIIRGPAARDWFDTIGLPARLVRLDGTVTTCNHWPTEEMR